jgi:hypothetical protein
MSAVDSRLLEIVGILLRRSLTLIEAHELRESHRYISDREWRMARVMNKLHLARQTRDWSWFEQLMKEYEKVMKLY